MTTVYLCDNVVFRSFGAETVLLNLATGQYHGVKGSGGRMLELLAEMHDLEAAAQLVAAEYGHSLEQVRRDMRGLCDALAARALVELREDGT